jgi:outer membrane biosynthesis protein TonB
MSAEPAARRRVAVEWQAAVRRRTVQWRQMVAQPAESPAERTTSGGGTPVSSNAVYPGGFGRINTAPIRDQIQQLYKANQAGLLVIPAGRLRVGVTGGIRPDGTLKNYRLIYPSGIPEVDASALAILEAVSESRHLGRSTT